MGEESAHDEIERLREQIRRAHIRITALRLHEFAVTKAAKVPPVPVFETALAMEYENVNEVGMNFEAGVCAGILATVFHRGDA